MKLYKNLPVKICLKVYIEMLPCSSVLCPSLILTSGMLSYSDPTLGENTVATHTCNDGFSLTTDVSTRTCIYGVGSYVSPWSGSPLMCAGMPWILLTHTVTTIILIISQRAPVQTSLLYWMEWLTTALNQIMATDELVQWPFTSATLDTTLLKVYTEHIRRI